MGIPYVKVVDGAATAYPYTIGQLRKDNPNTSFPKELSDQLLSEWGLQAVSKADAPSFDSKTQRVEVNALPSLVNGAWVLGHSVVDMTADEISELTAAKAAEVRADRDARLAAEVDALGINPLRWDEHTQEQKDKIAAHRRALLDITDQDGFPFDVVWPTLVL